MDPTERLRIAGRIDLALSRHFGDGIDVSALLSQPDYAREVMYVCRGLEDAELKDLARRFERLTAGLTRPRPGVAVPELTRAEAPPPRRPTDAPQDAAWSQDTSGFGLTRTPELHDEIDAPQRPAPADVDASPSPARGGLRRLGQWFRRDGSR